MTSADSGSTWAADTTSGGRDLGFKAYMETGFASSGDLVSSLKDSNPAGGKTPSWSTLSFTASTPANTALAFQAAGSNSAFGPFNFVGPDGTAGTFFTTTGADISQFNGNRYLRYTAFLSTSDSTATPTLSDVTVCYSSSCIAPATPTITPGGPTTFCAGGSVALTSSSASGNQWYVGGNPIGGATNQQYAATASGSYTVVVTAAGCPSAPSAGTTVTVNPIPATATITPGGPTTFCSGGSVTLTSSSASGNQWYVGGNPIGGATAQQVVATASGSYTVVVTAAGCPSAASAGTTVTVNPLPPVPVISAPASVYPGSVGNIASVTPTAGSTYAWAITGGEITSGPTGTSITFTAGPVGTLMLSVVETDANGCVSNTGSVNVAVTGYAFYALTPCRLFDTRNPDGAYGGPALAALATRTFVASGRCGIPSGAKAMSINLTVTEATAAGSLDVYAADIVPNPVPIINYAAGQTRANNGMLSLGAAGDFVMKSDQATGTVHVIVDVNGYFE